MGYYIETGKAKGKAEYIINNYEATMVTKGEAEKRIIMMRGEIGVIVVVDNGPFEAAGFAYDKDEFDAFHEDNRPKKYLLLPWEKATELAGYIRG